jgi:iron complex outermembrane receptor protein
MRTSILTAATDSGASRLPRSATLAAAIALVLTVAPHRVVAQEAALEEIIVTAQRREEKLQDVPVAITAFSATDIEARGINTTRDVLPSIPNVTYDESFTIGNSFVSVRGVAQINNADSPIAIVVDGVPQNSQKQLRMELFDIERIEVLKGPQGRAVRPQRDRWRTQHRNPAPDERAQGLGRGGLRFGQHDVRRRRDLGSDCARQGAVPCFRCLQGLGRTIDNEFLDEEVDFYTSKDVRGRMIFMPTDALEIDVRASWSNLDGGAVMDASMPPGDPANANREVAPRSDILGNSEREITDATVKLDWRTGLWHADLDHRLHGSHRGLLRRSRLLQSRRLPGRHLRAGPAATRLSISTSSC